MSSSPGRRMFRRLSRQKETRVNSPINRVAPPPAAVPEMVCEIKVLVPKGTNDPVVMVRGITDKAFLTGVLELAKLKVATQKDKPDQPGIEVPTPEAQKALLS